MFVRVAKFTTFMGLLVGAVPLTVVAQPAPAAQVCSGFWKLKGTHQTTVNWPAPAGGSGITTSSSGTKGAYTGSGSSPNGGIGIAARSRSGWQKREIYGWDNGAGATPASTEKCTHGAPAELCRVNASSIGTVQASVSGAVWGAGNQVTANASASIQAAFSGGAFPNGQVTGVTATGSGSTQVPNPASAGTITFNVMGVGVSAPNPLNINALWNPGTNTASFDKASGVQNMNCSITYDVPGMGGAIGYNIQCTGSISISGTKPNGVGVIGMSATTTLTSELSCSGGRADGCCNGSTGTTHSGHSSTYVPGNWQEIP